MLFIPPVNIPVVEMTAIKSLLDPNAIVFSSASGSAKPYRSNILPVS